MRSLEESHPERQEVDGRCQGLEEGEGSQCFMGTGSPFGEDEHILETDGGDGNHNNVSIFTLLN